MTSRTRRRSSPDTGTATASRRSTRGRSLVSLALAAAAAGALAAPASAAPPSFGTAANLDTGSAGSAAAAIGDLNGDGTPDLATAIRSEGLAVFLGTGGGSFGPVAKFPAPNTGSGLFMTSVTIRDLNGDGDPDVVGQAARDNVALVWLGDGTGGFSAGTAVQINPLPDCDLSGENPCEASFPADVVVGDFDEDGAPDLATSNANTDNVTIVLGAGDGTFGAPTQFPLNGGSLPQGLVTADVDEDGNLDLLTANAGSGDVSVLLGDGDGAFATASNFSAGIFGAAKLDLADVDEDGNLDVVVVNGAGAGSAAVLLGDGSGGFGTASVISAGANPTSVSAADITGDGHVDLTISNLGSSDVQVRAGNGAGSFATAVSFGLNGGTRPAEAAVGDVDGDGRRDIVTANDNFSSANVDDVSVLLNTTNRPPVAVNNAYNQIGSDTALVVAAPGVLGNDTDADGDALTAAQVSGPTHGTLTLNANGSFTYDANDGYVGSDSFTYKANDGTDDSNVATVTITVQAGCKGLPATITGSGVVNGTIGNDVIVTGNNADTVNGGIGNDTICTFGGNDVVSGGIGTDRIDSGDGDDNVEGGIGDDQLDGGEGNDTLAGGIGIDTVRGQGGNDSVSGGNDNDTVIGGAGSDVLAGNLGTDLCAGDNNGGPAVAGTDSVAPSGSCETVVEVP